MLYPIYIKPPAGNEAYEIIFPDFDGMSTCADTLDEVPQMAREYADLQFEGGDGEVPPPSDLEDMLGSTEYTGGIWSVVDLPYSN